MLAEYQFLLVMKDMSKEPLKISVNAEGLGEAYAKLLKECVNNREVLKYDLLLLEEPHTLLSKAINHIEQAIMTLRNEDHYCDQYCKQDKDIRPYLFSALLSAQNAKDLVLRVGAERCRRNFID